MELASHKESKNTKTFVFEYLSTLVALANVKRKTYALRACTVKLKMKNLGDRPYAMSPYENLYELIDLKDHSHPRDERQSDAF